MSEKGMGKGSCHERYKIGSSRTAQSVKAMVVLDCKQTENECMDTITMEQKDYSYRWKPSCLAYSDLSLTHSSFPNPISRHFEDSASFSSTSTSHYASGHLAAITSRTSVITPFLSIFFWCFRHTSFTASLITSGSSFW